VRVAFAFFAEAVSISEVDRVDVRGAGADTIWAARFPTPAVQLPLVCRIEASPRECEVPHELRFELIDADGYVVCQSWQMTWRPERRAAEPYRVVHVTIVPPLGAIRFPAPGDYSLHILADNHELAVVPLYVRAA